MTELVKIPIERVKVLRGENGATAEEIEQKCGVELIIEKEGDITIEGKDGNPTNEFFAKDVVKAIGRGFTPKDALKLIDQDHNLYIIPLKEVVESESAITRLKGRVIGREGKTKTEIEAATRSKICVYGNTVGIISGIETIEYAKQAVYMMLEGATNTALLTYLAKVRRELYEVRLEMK